ncbi:hypothetical protein [Roseobacter fucihabitans]|uniref:hypothetical protein n=1 Tax=Roseobacter fucihabitans TaxID=1537242 RepID=UPI001CA34564|nr:hypothetical protein [Roseobacter litoralis]
MSRPNSAKLAFYIEIIEGKFFEGVMVKRVAVFVDGENISFDHAEAVYQVAKGNGPVHVQRV